MDRKVAQSVPRQKRSPKKLRHASVPLNPHKGNSPKSKAPSQKKVVAPARERHYLTMHFLIAGLIGLVSGVTSGLFGVGGGIIMVPAMMFFMGVPVHTAVGTSLVVIIPTAIASSLKHYHQGNLNLPLALALAPTAILGGVFGAWLTKAIAPGDLKRAFGGFLVLVGLRLLFFK
jgi:uncharacterized protein